MPPFGPKHEEVTDSQREYVRSLGIATSPNPSIRAMIVVVAILAIITIVVLWYVTTHHHGA